MDKIPLFSLPNLTDSDKSVLRKGKVSTVGDLVLARPQDLAKRCHVPLEHIIRLIQATYNNQGTPAIIFQTLEGEGSEEGTVFSIGDPELDEALGGGFRTGMVWEIVGESAAGKTQFALQSSLHVQLPRAQGGLDGSACYLTTSTKLQTTRLLQILQTRNLSDASLEDVHTLSAPTVHVLLNVLEDKLPTYIETIAKSPTRKPIKLLIIDALAELFHLVEKASSTSFIERSQQLTRISALLHRLALKYHIAVVVLNEVVDAFDNYTTGFERSEDDQLLYAEQARWFNRAHSIYAENLKEASLGLVWANQVNARVMLTRTGRRRYVGEEEEAIIGDGDKWQKMEGEDESDPRPSITAADREPHLIRRLTVIFTSAGSPTSCDYIVTPAGVKGLLTEDKPMQTRVPGQTPRSEGTDQPSSSNTLPCCSNPEAQPISQAVIPSSQDEEYDNLWIDEVYENVDWDSLERTLTQAQVPNR